MAVDAWLTESQQMQKFFEQALQSLVQGASASIIFKCSNQKCFNFTYELLNIIHKIHYYFHALLFTYNNLFWVKLQSLIFVTKYLTFSVFSFSAFISTFNFFTTFSMKVQYAKLKWFIVSC